MRIWIFSGGEGLMALTNDADGACLPTEFGPWRSVAARTLNDDDAEEREAIELIRDHGFCCFDADPDS